MGETVGFLNLHEESLMQCPGVILPLQVVFFFIHEDASPDKLIMTQLDNPVIIVVIKVKDPVR
jgi:hypothetical protein